MKLNEYQDTESTEFAEGAAAERDVQVPLHAGVLGEEAAIDPLAGASRARRFSGGTILIAVVVVIAAAGLFTMRQLLKITSVKAIAGEAETMVETFLASRQTTHAGEADRAGRDVGTDDTIIEVLSESYTEHQVPLHDVQKNPFILLAVAAPDATKDPNGAIDDFNRRRTERRAEFEDFAGQLRLKSIMGGATPLALIGNTIVHEGDEIALDSDGVKMTVEKIAPTEVVLLGSAPELDLAVRISLEVSRDATPRPKSSKFDTSKQK